MPSTVQRRPLPALVALLALLLLTALVWWRVIDRGDSDAPHHTASHACPSASASASASSSAHALPAPSSVNVAVLNATTRKGLAAKVRSALIDVGFKSPSAAANDDTKKINKIKSSAEIRYGPTGKAGASLLHYYLPGSTLVPTTSKTATVVVALGNAYRDVASTATVTAELKKANLVAGTPSPSASC